MDENLPQRVAQAARSRGLDVTSSHELERDESTDTEQLKFAAREGRCLVTRDYGDFSDDSGEFERLHVPHAGVLLVSRSLPNRDVGGIVRALERIDHLYPDGLPPYCVMYLTPVEP